MKTPEEIKKGLECGFCHECPYDEPEFETVEECARQVHRDALAYIQQLEEGIDNATQLVQSANELIKKRLNDMEARLAQAGQDAKEMARDLDCSACTWCEYGDFDYKKEACKECRTYNEGFKLRGVCPENTKEDTKE